MWDTVQEKKENTDDWVEWGLVEGDEWSKWEIVTTLLFSKGLPQLV